MVTLADPEKAPALAADLTRLVLTGELDKDAVVRAVEVAGQISGACDFRPRYGRFAVDSVVEG